MIRCVPWFENIFEPKNLTNLLEFCCKKIAIFRKAVPFDGIAFIGMSGTLLAPLISERMQIPLLMVRKDADYQSSHDYREVSGNFDIKRYVILDDLIGTGKTLSLIKWKIESRSVSFTQGMPELVGVMLYATNCCDHYFSWKRKGELEIGELPPSALSRGIPNVPILKLDPV
jgi:orotate phosphoribosyltransferase-like protein